MPIPFSNVIGVDGVPNFRATDGDKWHKCAIQRLCGICGQFLEGPLHFIGGEKCVENMLYFDPPMHRECADFSAQACPFLNGSKDYAQEIKPSAGYQQVAMHAVSTERPKRTGILTCRDYSLMKFREQMYFKPQGVITVEWFA